MASGNILRRVLVGTIVPATIALATSLASVAPAVIGAAAFGFSGNAQALACSTPDQYGLCTSATAFQYGGGFNPQAGEFGGFGGATGCTVTRTPVVFVHGNGDNA